MVSTEVSAYATCGQDYETTNSNAQNYTKWSTPIESYLTETTDGKLMRVQKSDDNTGILVEYYTKDYKLQESRIIDDELPIFGGFYATDENYYILSGQNNSEKDDTVEVLRLTKYDKDWNRIASASEYGANTKKPFDAGSARMTHDGKYLFIRTCHLMYSGHQANYTIQVDTEQMKVTSAFSGVYDSTYGYISHSFNQFVVNDESNVYFLDHGDAYDRGLILSSFSTSSDGHIAQRSAVNIFPFMGPAGQNYTGCQVTGFSLAGDNLITVGRSVPHSFSVNGLTGYENLNLNAFMIITDKNSMASRFIWLTQYSPSGDVIRLTEPKLIPVGNNQYTVLFSDETSKQSVLHYLLMDGSGNILLSKLYKNVTIQTDSQPILWGRNIVWTSGNYDNHNYDGTETFLYEIPVVTTPLSGIALDQTSLTLDEGKNQKLTPSFAPVDSDDVKDMSWTSSNPKIVSVSADGTIKGNGYGQAVITASTGEFQAQCQVTVRVSETDDPLATPTLKLSQKAANKMRLIWKKVPGAKGYQIYCKTNSQSSYKRIKTLKTWSVSYDAAVVPGVKYSFKVRAYGTNASGKTKYSRFSPVKSQKAVVPAPSKISCKMSTGGTLVSWSKVAGASGYVIYRNGEAAKTVKASISSWKDPESYDSQTGMYWIDNYYIKAFKNVNGKRIYSKPTKAVNFRS